MADSWLDRGGHLWPKDRTVRRQDGTVVRYAVRGPLDGPAVVCCAGFLCPDNFWRVIAPDLARDHRVVMLNYRGVGASSEAGGGAEPSAAGAYRLEHLAGDVAATLDAEGIGAATVIGHSMGTQVALALWRARPELVGALALLAGPYASPFRSFYGNAAAAAVFPAISMTMPALPHATTRLVMRALELPIAMRVGRAIRAIGPSTPDEGMRAYRSHMGRVHPRTAIWTARGMHAFDASPWLHEIDVPALIAVGDADAWTPPAVGRRFAEGIADAELVVVPGASHTLPIEFPELLLPRIRALLSDAQYSIDA